MSTEIVMDGLAFPECPRWHDGSLYFSDMHAGAVWRLAKDGKATKVLELITQPAGLGWMPDGSMRVVSMLDRLLRREDGSVVADLSFIATGQTNDMVIDREGRCYIGNFGFDLNGGESPKPTVLIALDPHAWSPRIAADDLWFPNGMVIPDDGKTLIVAETFAGRLTAFDIQPGGSLTNRRVFALLEGIYADGICLDAENAVWVTCASGHRTIRVREGGEITHEILHEQDRSSYACMLGGPDRRDLYICTAADHLPEKTRALRSGRIERVRVDVPGAGLP